MTTKKGTYYESMAAKYLQKKGLYELNRNFRHRRGEIDLIMRHADALVFIEVRYRKQSGFGSAEGKGKQNDWVFSNAFKRYILKHYNGAEPQIDEHEGVTDGCRGQVSCFARLLASYDKQALLTLLFSTCEVS